MSRTIEHGGSAIFVWGCTTSCGMGDMYKMEGNMTQASYLGVLQDGVMKTTEWCCLNPSHVIFQHDNDAISGCRCKNLMYLLGLYKILNPVEHVWALVRQKDDTCRKICKEEEVVVVFLLQFL